MNSSIRQENNKGHDTRTGSPINVLKNINDLYNNGRDVPLYYLRKKGEKLATAVYIVTGFLSDNEPIKWQIRECGLSILSDVVSVADSRVSDMPHRVKSVTAGINKIISLFEIAAVAGFVSGMNLAILKEEYQSLVEIIENRKIGKPEGGYIFSREFFSAPEPAPSFSPEKDKATPEDFYKGHFKKNNEIVSTVDKGHEGIKAEQLSTQGGVSDIVSKNSSLKIGGKDSRRQTILDIVKGKGNLEELSIKDIVGHFSDCGEKTIQRELTVLVEEGVLKKTGERRWSRYSLST